MTALGYNSGRRFVRHVPKSDPFAVYDTLPPEIRAALQEGVVDVCPLSVRRILRRHLRNGLNQEVAVSFALLSISWAQQAAVKNASLWQPDKRKTKRPSPHLLAGATMQTSRRGVVSPRFKKLGARLRVLGRVAP